jgi:hypothetical protein
LRAATRTQLHREVAAFAVDLANSKHNPLMEERQRHPDRIVLDEGYISTLTILAQAERL